MKLSVVKVVLGVQGKIKLEFTQNVRIHKAILLINTPCSFIFHHAMSIANEPESCHVLDLSNLARQSPHHPNSTPAHHDVLRGDDARHHG